MKPVLAIELDDTSHQRKPRQTRDELVDQAFAAAGLPILHVKCRQAYAPEELRQQIRHELKMAATPESSSSRHENPGGKGIASASEAPLLTSDSRDEVPHCPKCNDPMVKRKAARGKHANKQFWACPNYPRCRKIIPID